MPIQDFNTLLRIMGAMASNDDCDNLFWRTDGSYAPITVFAICNDLFYWGTADLEEITGDNIANYEETVKELKAIAEPYRAGRVEPAPGDQDMNLAHIYAMDLFCCRVRKMRPQRPCYKRYPPGLHRLFDACGEERKE